MVNEIMINKVTQIISEQLKFEPGKKVDWDQNLQELGADSLDMVELVIKLEDAFKIVISDQSMAKFSTGVKLVEVVSYLE